MKKLLCLWILLCALLLCASALAQEEPPVITVDGDMSDWAGIYSLCPGEGKMGVLYGLRTDDTLYMAFQSANNAPIAIYDVMFNTDADPATGYQCDGRHKPAGADFLVETWASARYAGATGAEWEWAEDVFPVQKASSGDNTVVEIAVPLEVLGFPEKVTAAAWSMDENWEADGFAPVIGDAFVEIPYYTQVIGAPITEPLSEVGLEAEPVQALTENAMPGGLVGTLTAQGGDGQTYDFAFREDAAKGRDNGRFVIDGNALRVGESPLAPGTYKIALQCTSLLRKETADAQVLVLPQDPATPITPDIFDGKDGQWYTVAHSAAYEPPNLSVLKAQTDGKLLFFYLGAQALGDEYALYLGNENDGEGDGSLPWAGAPPAHKITPDGVIWAWQEGAYVDTGSKAYLRKTSQGLEGRLLCPSLNPAAKAFTLGAMDGEGGCLPDAGQPMLAITAPERMFSPLIKADGSTDSWEYVPLLAGGSGVVGDVYAARTNDALYVSTTVSGITDPDSDTAFSLNILIDADRDPSTGFAHPGYPGHSGIDVLVQDWHSMSLELFIFPKPTAEWFSCVYRKPEGIKKLIQEEGEGVYRVQYIIPVSLIAAQLPEVSDDWYIAVDRQQDMQEGTSVGTAPEAYQADSALRLAPKYRINVENALSVTDESFDDWDAVANKAVPAALVGTQNLLVTRSQDTLYVLAQDSGLSTDNVWYLSAGDGFPLDGLAGVTHVARGGALFAVTGDGQQAQEGVPVYEQYYGTSAELQIPLEMLGDPESIAVAFKGRGTALPQEGMMAVEDRFTLSRQEGAYFPKEDFGTLVNPYHGWMAWASISPQEPVRYPFTTLYLDVKWAEFEPEKGRYDFEALERTYHLSAWREMGKRVILRFVMDDVIDNGGADRMDIPPWLYEELVAENANGKGAGTFYYEPEDLGGGGFSPNYESPLLLAYHDQAIQALAERFDDPGVTAYVQVGSLGHWAEMHCWPDGTGEFPNPALVARYMESYTKAFHNVKMAARKPYPYASQENWGLYNDMFGDVGATDMWVSYYREGCTDMPGATAQEVEASAMPQFWHHGYSGGEFAEGNVRKWMSDDAIAETLRLIREAHSSLIGPCAPTDILTTDADANAFDRNVEAMMRVMGWRYALESLTRVEAAKAGETLTLEMVWNNRGVSPFYYPWPLELSLADAAGQVAAKQTLQADVTAWLPGRSTIREAFTVPSGLPAGAYTLCVAMLDPATGEPAMELAIQGGREDLRYPLYEVAVE